MSRAQMSNGRLRAVLRAAMKYANEEAKTEGVFRFGMPLAYRSAVRNAASSTQVLHACADGQSADFAFELLLPLVAQAVPRGEFIVILQLVNTLR